MAIDQKTYIRLRTEYFAKFQRAYSQYMRALSDATNRYSSRLPVESSEYEFAISKATGEFLKEIGNLKGAYRELSAVDRSIRGY